MSAISRKVGWMAMDGAASSVLEHDGLEHGEAVQRFEALLAAVTRMPNAAERQLDAAARAVAVDEHLAAADRTRHPELPAAIARPDARDEPERRAVRDEDRLRLIAERHCRQHRSEHLLARKTRRRRHVADQARLDVVAARRRIARKCSLRDGRAPVTVGFGQEPANALELARADQRAAVEVRQSRTHLE